MTAPTGLILIVGVRTLWDLSERWSIDLGGNIGGFGVGADFSWMDYLLGGYRFTLFGKVR